ncbi:MAG: HEPN domain-containing protein [Candidatus Gastranaerophilales bacterium]|nr:HEPN domain-containing protein [Candidatus Gastranaerophilales bacterium]
MKQHKGIMVKVAIEKAEDALKSSNENIDINLYTSQNRAYYAVFYIVMALAYLDDFVTKSHHKLMGQFNKRYIYEQKVFDKYLIEIYTNLIKKRESADYDFTYKLTKDKVLKDIESAKTFINSVKPYVLKKLGKEAD